MGVKKNGNGEGYTSTTIAVKLAELQGQQNSMASDITEIKGIVQENAKQHAQRLAPLERDLEQRTIVAQYKKGQWKTIAAWVSAVTPLVGAILYALAKLTGLGGAILK